MRPFHAFTGIAAPLPIANIDTDQIIPSQYLKVVSRDGLGEGLLAPLRYDATGQERSDFILNREPWRHAEILIARENFGCGSSREHALWALIGFGVRTIIAPSFATIFSGNAVRNGLLPAVIDPAQVEKLLALVTEPSTAAMTVDLEAQTISTATGDIIQFTIPQQSREALLNGLDEIGRTLHFEDAIADFEMRHLAEVSTIPRWPDLARLAPRT